MSRHRFCFRLAVALVFLVAYAHGLRWVWRRDVRLPAKPPRELRSDLRELLRPGGTDWREVGRSREGRPIWLVEHGSGPEVTLIFGGIHGNELDACRVARALCARLRGRVPSGKKAVVIPLLNPDGVVRLTRTNAGGVDVNRNFPTQNWRRDEPNPHRSPGASPGSEPETRLAMELVERWRPAKIISIHDPLRVNNYDGPGEVLARVMARENGYPVVDSIGYPTPGSFGTWAGAERQIPMVTLEVERGASGVEKNLRALEIAVKF